MAEPDNIVLEYLRRIDRRLEELAQKSGNVVARLGSLEDQFVVMKSAITLLRTGFARLEHRMDRMEKRLERIERRLDLIEA